MSLYLASTNRDFFRPNSISYIDNEGKSKLLAISGVVLLIIAGGILLATLTGHTRIRYNLGAVKIYCSILATSGGSL